MDVQIKKGILEMCLLYKLSTKDYYGYNLMKEWLRIKDIVESLGIKN